MKPDYCSQNDGDCASCSLSSYGRDCLNKPIRGGILEDMHPDEIECAAVRFDSKGNMETVEGMGATLDTGELEIVAMDETTFQHEMSRARMMREHDWPNGDYWLGYQRGLRRAYHGSSFGTAEEHALWLSLIDDADSGRRERGKGYQAGLTGRPDDCRPC